ncbi:1-acyl-sn-glycerol-3-phosphate acyltransferase alpha-like [Corticium candelabrum]|uniref:1-acyl-sn-glycerol-3-phosphate acyltransferase alpha-like n=1 Tax=Corticium candelabrum TaxID=121492 RepID=UPI002E273373|nr:1-acyl-sn-glycerol-3-phosphate acyltransferase alpha-like [Corticium candelabrum]
MGLIGWLVFFFLLALFFYVLSRVSQQARYTIKHAIYFAVVFIISCCVILDAILHMKRSHENAQVLKRVTKLLRVKRLLGIQYSIEGEEILDDCESPRIYISNHQSSLDMLGISLIWPRRTVLMAKRSLKYVPVFGLSAWLVETIFIDRVKKEKAKKVLDKTVKKIKDERLSLWMFPEGTRNHKGSMLPFRKGAFHLALDAQIPIVPIVFSPYTFYDKKVWKFKDGSVKLTVMDPISTEGMTSEDIDDLMSSVRDKMLGVYSRGLVPSDGRSFTRIS